MAKPVSASESTDASLVSLRHIEPMMPNPSALFPLTCSLCGEGDHCREDCRPLVSDEVRRVLISDGFYQLQDMHCLCYCTESYPFRSLVCALLGLHPATEETLAHLHCSPVLAGAGGKKSGKRALTRRYHARSDKREAFLRCYERFVREVVGPMLAEALPSTTHIVYQRFPVLRISPPNSIRLGKRHKDAHYHHQPGQINWWLPLVAVWGCNSLHCESRPGAGDFAPFEAEYGQVIRFYGNGCEHYTVPNNSGRTRVSLDFRVIPSSAFDPDPLVSRHRQRPENAQIFTLCPPGEDSEEHYYKSLALGLRPADTVKSL